MLLEKLIYSKGGFKSRIRIYYSGFRTYRIIAGFRNYLQDHIGSFQNNFVSQRQLSESRNKLLEEGFRTVFRISKYFSIS
jgi:hypothetical protein